MPARAPEAAVAPTPEGFLSSRWLGYLLASPTACQHLWGNSGMESPINGIFSRGQAKQIRILLRSRYVALRLLHSALVQLPVCPLWVTAPGPSVVSSRGKRCFSEHINPATAQAKTLTHLSLKVYNYSCCVASGSWLTHQTFISPSAPKKHYPSPPDKGVL